MVKKKKMMMRERMEWGGDDEVEVDGEEGQEGGDGTWDLVR